MNPAIIASSASTAAENYTGSDGSNGSADLSKRSGLAFVTTQLRSSSVPLSNYSNSMFGSVTRAVQLMGRLAEGHPYRIEPEVVRVVVDLLGVLSAKQQADAPKIFNLDEETLVLKWVKNGREQFVSVSSDEVDFAEFVQGGDKKAEKSLGEPSRLNYAEFFRALDVQDSTQSTQETRPMIAGIAYAR